MAAVLLAKTIHKVILVFEGSATQVVGHSDVKHTRFAGDDVDAVAVGFHGRGKQQVPPLRIAIGGTNRNVPVGMTDLILALIPNWNATPGVTE